MTAAVTDKTTIQSLDIATPDGTCDSRLATPKDAERSPGVLFCMDAFGVRPVIDEWIQRIAAQGYVVLAPNLLYRSARSPIIEDVAAAMASEDRSALFQRLMPMMKLLTQENVAKDTEAYVAALRSQSETGSGPLGVTGYCMGARFAMRAAAACPQDFAIVAGFHGGNLATQEPDSPHLMVNRLKAEVYMGFADHDEGASPEQVARLEAALTSADLRHQLEVFPDAPHGYTMSDTPAYRQEAAERHFQKLIDLLDRNLKGSS
jgi:carboxymethylenebutenolidase